MQSSSGGFNLCNREKRHWRQLSVYSELQLFSPRSVGPHRMFLWDPCNSCVQLTIGVSGVSTLIRVPWQREQSILVSLSRGFVTRHDMIPRILSGTEEIEEALGWVSRNSSQSHSTETGHHGAASPIQSKTHRHPCRAYCVPDLVLFVRRFLL